jgi:hypothetical protein
MLEVWWASQAKTNSNPPQATTSNLNPSHPCSYCNAYEQNANHCFTFHLELQHS